MYPLRMWNFPIRRSQIFFELASAKGKRPKNPFSLSYTTKGGHDLYHLDRDHGNGSDSTTTPKDFLIWKFLTHPHSFLGLYKPFGFYPRWLKAIESRVKSRRVTLVQSWLYSVRSS